MISFFRKIRQNLLNEGKTARYVKYAIGEILLVVIGILIALQINTWNEARKQYFEDVEFIKILRSELSLDIQALSEKREEYLSINNDLKSAYGFLKSKNEINEDETIIISNAFGRLAVLTPINKNSQRSDAKITEGSLLRLSPELNHKYIKYLEQTESRNDIISKLGETLQLINIQDVYPNLDINIDMKADAQYSLNKYNFKFGIIKQSRSIKNAMAISIRFRTISIRFVVLKMESAQALIDNIDKILTDLNKN